MNSANRLFRSGSIPFACTQLLILLLGFPGQASSATTPGSAANLIPPAGEPFRFEPINGASLGLWTGDQPILVYNHGPVSSARSPGARSRSAYIHPLYGLDGEVLTDDFPKDHDYHRGLYWAWPHITVAGVEYDSWSLRGIRTEFQRWLERETAPHRAVLGLENGWFVGDTKVMQEKVRIEVHTASAQSRAIDLELTWTPTDRPITLRGAEGKSYGGLNLRFGPRSKTIITVPSGWTTEDLLISKLPWADFSGDLKGPGELSGAAIFVHPAHPAYPPTWMTRHYGFLAVGWPGVTPQTLPAGQAFVCRYRIWIHRGAPEVAALQAAYEGYLNARREGRDRRE